MLQAPRIVRWTLPALLLTLVVGGYLIVSNGLREDKSQAGSSQTQTTTTKHRRKPRHAKVHHGDTPSSIARRAHLTVPELLKLNPKVDPRLLRPGQRLKISR
jgi:LysM repeat protein